MKKIDELLNQTPGSTLFHYTNATGLLGILEDKNICRAIGTDEAYPNVGESASI
jgi:hypothetical protein